MQTSRMRNEKLNRRLPAFVVVCCVLQPLLDVAGYWQQHLGFANYLTLALRALLLLSVMALGFLLSERKRCYVILAVMLGLLTALHAAANLPGGYLEPVEDFAALSRIYLLPVSCLCFITFLRRGGERVLRAFKLGLSLDLAIILLVELLSVLTGTNRWTYVSIQIGVIGWFVWGNCQSAILSMLTPVVICLALLRWRDRLLPVGLVTLAAMSALYFFGTRLSFAALIGSGLGVGVCLLLLDRRRWKQALVIVLSTVVLTGLYPLSPSARRMQSLEESVQQGPQLPYDPFFPASVTQAPTGQRNDPAVSPQSGPSDVPAPERTSELDRNPDMAMLEALYHQYFSSVIDRFGIERLAESYRYTQDPAVLSDIRVCKRIVCELVMEESPALCRWFGLSVREMFIPVSVLNEETGLEEKEMTSFEVENDFVGIYYCLGVVGLVLTAVFLLYFGLRILRKLLREGKNALSLELIGFGGAYVFALAHAWFTTSVLRRNNASVYLAIVLAVLWYLTRKDAPEPGENAVLAQALPGRRDYGEE